MNPCLSQLKKKALILKLVLKDVFLRKPKLQYHLCQYGEYVYGAQSWKERRLLHESMYIQICEWTLILKMVEREVFLVGPKH